MSFKLSIVRAGQNKQFYDGMGVCGNASIGSL